jgi:MarR family 2-MHQ and catechol resistance regulon transcriptional repressor
MSTAKSKPAKSASTSLPKVTPADAERFDLEQDAKALHEAVSDLVRVYQFRDRDKICCYDVSVTQCYAMETLSRHGPLQMGELATSLYLDKSTTSRVVDALERKKYVERIPSATDRRALALRITPSGKKLIDQIHTALIEQQKALVRDLDPQLRATVTDVIQRLAKAAEARFISGTSCGPPSSACCPTGKPSCG